MGLAVISKKPKKLLGGRFRSLFDLLGHSGLAGASLKLFSVSAVAE
jgi:hypothetical protein